MNEMEIKYVCINCDNGVPDLYRKLSYNAVKPLLCNKCHKIADKYIEFEPVIILVDALLLSKQAYRHMIYNHDFKLHWKLSLVLLLLESFALWHKKQDDFKISHNSARYDELLQEKGFYSCCLENIFDYLIITLLLFLCNLYIRRKLVENFGLRRFGMTLLKAIAIANFSKFFLLPIMVWRENTTELGSNIHHLLVTWHHLCALIYVFSVVSRIKKLRAALIMLPAYIVKEYIKDAISQQLIRYL